MDLTWTLQTARPDGNVGPRKMLCAIKIQIDVCVWRNAAAMVFPGCTTIRKGTSRQSGQLLFLGCDIESGPLGWDFGLSSDFWGLLLGLLHGAQLMAVDVNEFLTRSGGFCRLKSSSPSRAVNNHSRRLSPSLCGKTLIQFSSLLAFDVDFCKRIVAGISQHILDWDIFCAFVTATTRNTSHHEVQSHSQPASPKGDNRHSQDACLFRTHSRREQCLSTTQFRLCVLPWCSEERLHDQAEL